MKLKTKIQLFTSLVMLILVVLVNTSIYFLFYKITADNELEQLSVQTNAIVETLNTNDEIAEKEVLRAFLPVNGMIRVIDKTGEELIPTITKKKDYLNLSYKYFDSEVHEIITDDILGKVAVITKPIIWEGENIATLQVSVQLVTLSETMKTLFYVLLAASLSVLIPTVIAGNLLSRFILRPIKLLINTMKRNTKQGEWVKIKLDNRSKDEIFEMEMTFNEMIEQLQINYEKQEVFVSDASHELKTPISIIKGYAQLIERRGESHPEVLAESVRAIDSEAERMNQLVEQLLLLAKNKEDITFEKVDVISLSEKIIKSFRDTNDREICIETDLDELIISANRSQIEQLLYILISNALKYSDEVIKVFIRKQAETVSLRFVDRGVGISKTDLEHIFHRFYRIDKARTRSTGGTGLGLAIAKQIALAHGGNISVESILDVGSTFTLKLPIKHD